MGIEKQKPIVLAATRNKDRNEICVYNHLRYFQLRITQTNNTQISFARLLQGKSKQLKQVSLHSCILTLCRDDCIDDLSKVYNNCAKLSINADGLKSERKLNVSVGIQYLIILIRLVTQRINTGITSS